MNREERDKRDKWTETLLRFYEQEGYFPDLDKPESGRRKEAGAPEQPTRPRLVLRNRRRYWK